MLVITSIAIAVAAVALIAVASVVAGDAVVTRRHQRDHERRWNSKDMV